MEHSHDAAHVQSQPLAAFKPKPQNSALKSLNIYMGNSLIVMPYKLLFSSRWQDVVWDAAVRRSPFLRREPHRV